MGRELEIIVKTTGACNARCLYCSAGSDPAGERKLSIDAARTLCDQAARLLESGRFDRVRFLWHGGEPLLLGKRFFRELFSFGRPGVFRHNVQTNLTLLDGDWIEILEGLIGRDGIGTSADPFDDVRRMGHRGEYTRRWLRGMELLERANWRAGCVYVVHRRSLERAKDLYWFFRNLRDGSSLSLRVNPLLRVGRATGPACEELVLSPGQYGAFLIELARVWLADHRRLILSPLKDIVRAWQGEGRVRSCDLAGRAGCTESHLGIDPDGNVYNCGRAVDAGGLRFGNLATVSLADCLDHPSRQLLHDREAALLRARCGQCPDWRLCHGGCPYESHTASEQAHQPTLLCEDYRRLFHWLGDQLGPAVEHAAPSTASRPGTQRAAGSERARDRACQPMPPAALSPDASLDPSSSLPRNLPSSCPEDCLEAIKSPRTGPAARIVLDQLPSAIDRRLLADLASSGVPIWVPPDAPGGGLEAVRALTAAGVAVVIDHLKDWPPGKLTELAEFFLHAPDLEVPIEPFYAALAYLAPGGRTRSLCSLYGEAPPRDRRAICMTCEAFKCCRGYWLRPIADESHCREWRAIVVLLAEAFGTHAACAEPSPREWTD